MAKKDPRIIRIAKIELIGGQAKPGPALASVGINMVDFTRQFNDMTKDKTGEIIPCIINARKDKTFTFSIKTTPTPVLLKKAANIKIAGKNQLKDDVGSITKEQALEIVRYKLVDMNTKSEEAGLRLVAGTARQMGIKIEGLDLAPKKNGVQNGK